MEMLGWKVFVRVSIFVLREPVIVMKLRKRITVEINHLVRFVDISKELNLFQ